MRRRRARRLDVLRRRAISISKYQQERRRRRNATPVSHLASLDAQKRRQFRILGARTSKSEYRYEEGDVDAHGSGAGAQLPTSRISNPLRLATHRTHPTAQNTDKHAPATCSVTPDEAKATCDVSAPQGLCGCWPPTYKTQIFVHATTARKSVPAKGIKGRATHPKPYVEEPSIGSCHHTRSPGTS